MKNLAKIYKKSTDKNLKYIKSIIEKNLGKDGSELFLMCKEVLNASSENIVQKWISGRKYARTFFVQKAFSEFYPKKYLELSLLVDATVNMLDDLADEEIDKNQKILYIVEILRVISLYDLSNPGKEILENTGHYFNKLIVVPAIEQAYGKKISTEKQKEKIIKYSADLLLYRGGDIDIFNEIALSGERNKKAAEKIKKIGRIFRAANIFKKDVDDISYDQQAGLDSVVISMTQRKDFDFSEYTKGVLEFLLVEAGKIINSGGKAGKHKKIMQNYYRMIEENNEAIKQKLSVINK